MDHCLRRLLTIVSKSSVTSGARRLCNTTDTRYLLRDYIHDQLYNPTHGYFNAQKAPVAPLDHPLDFSKFLGKGGYLKAIDKLHQSLEVSWLTPSEIFTPHYGKAIASHILEVHRKEGQKALQIFELGAGTGTLALDILDHLRAMEPEIYKTCIYTSCEISPIFAEQQYRRLGRLHGHEKQFRIEIRDAADRSTWKQTSAQPCFFLGTEVLDNCAHDKVVKGDDERWLQEEVVISQGKASAELVPLADPLIMSVLECALNSKIPRPPLWERVFDLAIGYSTRRQYSQESTIFLPTKATMLLKTLHTVRPNHHLILADFNSLPDVQIKGRQAPLVTSKGKGQAPIDHSNYFVAKGSADIVFPTDFDFLCNLYRFTAGKGSNTNAVAKLTRDYMEKFADLEATTTMNNYNPLIEDFSNTSVFMGVSRLKTL